MKQTTQVLEKPKHGQRTEGWKELEDSGARIPLAMTFEELLGGGKSCEETADDMIGAVQEIRNVTFPRSLD